jgi:hypothetical protein
VDDIDVPNLTEQKLWEYLCYDLGVPVPRRSVKWAVIHREPGCVPTRLGGKNLFSRAGAHTWLASRRLPEPGRPVRARKTIATQ